MAAKKKSSATKRTSNGKKATKRKVSPVPKGYRTVTPSMTSADAGATIAFCRRAFGAKLRSKLPAPGGKLLYAEIEIGDSIVMVGDMRTELVVAAMRAGASDVVAPNVSHHELVATLDRARDSATRLRESTIVNAESARRGQVIVVLSPIETWPS